MNKKIIFLFLAVLIVGVCSSIKPVNKRDVLRVACGNDAAGALISYIANTLGEEIESETTEDIDFLQLTDCCGSQAEIALAAGEFQMAVLCPDAAKIFLDKTDDFVVAGGVIKNSNILVKKQGISINNVGYMNGRDLQKRIIQNYYKNAYLMPVMAAALPYALERDAVDAVVLDITGALKVDDYECIPLPYEEASSVLVVRKDLLTSKIYQNFIVAYNNTVEELNQSGAYNLLIELNIGKDINEEVDLWRRMQVQYLPILNEK